MLKGVSIDFINHVFQQGNLNIPNLTDPYIVIIILLMHKCSSGTNLSYLLSIVM